MAQTLTAPLAVIKSNGVPIGKMRNVRLTENVTRGRVTGLGRLAPEEVPATGWNGTLNCSFYMVDFKEEAIPDAIKRDVQTIEEFTNRVLFSDGIQIDVMRKVKGSDPANPALEVIASVKGAFITREGFDIAEGQVSGRDADFEYINPVIVPA